MRKLLSILLTLLMMAGGIAVAPILASAAGEAGYPFLLGAVKGADNNPLPLLTYTPGQSPGAVPMDGMVRNYPPAELFAQYNTYPDSDHPDGVAYFWVYDDADSVYFICDWTSDNTYDYGDDYFTVYIDDGAGVKAYTQHTDPVGGDYGQALFDATDMADFDHMWYVIAVPKADLNPGALKVGFELYGTANVSSSVSWNATPPATGTVGVQLTYSIKYDIASNNNGDHTDHMAIVYEYDDDGELDDFLNQSILYYSDSGEFYFSMYTGSFREITRKTFTVTPAAVSPYASTDIVNINVIYNTAGTHKIAVIVFYREKAPYENQWTCIHYPASSAIATTIVAPAPVAPTITGPTAMKLLAGYGATSTGAFTLTGAPAPSVTIDNTHGGKITWDGTKLNIAAGLAAGEYSVKLTASNGVGTNATATFKLTVAKTIFSTKYESNFLNWLLFLVAFGWIWMWF